MKKFISMILASALAISCLCTSAFAAGDKDTVTTVSSSVEKVVTITVNSQPAGTVYSVDIEWDDLNFTYNKVGGTWDPETHTYGSTSIGWDKTSANIKVTNHSNAGVLITSNFKESNDLLLSKGGVDGSLNNHSFALDAGEVNGYDTADNDTITVGISGVPETDSGFELGTVVVTVSAT